MSAEVIRLPTAATRKVPQPSGRDRLRLKAEMEQHPATYLPPWARKMDRERKALQGSALETVQDSAALLIVTAMLANADPVLKAKIYGQVAYLHQLYGTAETHKAQLIVEPMLNPFRPPPGAA